MKLKRSVVKKYHEGELYKFIGGVARVPGMWHKGFPYLPYTITLKEFKELTGY